MDIVELSLAHEAAFLQMMEDYQSKAPQESLSVCETGEYPSTADWTAAKFKKFIKECEKQRLDWRPGPGKISVSRYVLLDQAGQAILASGLMRFPLDEVTEVDGGNLRCDVPPSFRGRGCGSYFLSRLLFEAVRAGLRRVLVTCPETDLTSRRVIEKNRGTLQDVVLPQKIRRYWISFS